MLTPTVITKLSGVTEPASLMYRGSVAVCGAHATPHLRPVLPRKLPGGQHPHGASARLGHDLAQHNGWESRAHGALPTSNIHEHRRTTIQHGARARAARLQRTPLKKNTRDTASAAHVELLVSAREQPLPRRPQLAYYRLHLRRRARVLRPVPARAYSCTYSPNYTTHTLFTARRQVASKPAQKGTKQVYTNLDTGRKARHSTAGPACDS